MTLPDRDILHTVAALRDAGEAFALATVVRTVAVTAAKAGTKAVIRADGTISEGWIGGGCARGAVIRAAQEALADGQSRLIQISPADVLAAQGTTPGETRDGLHFARNSCPSKGTMDIFIEPMLPQPAVVIHGASPVALVLQGLAPQFGFAVRSADLPASGVVSSAAPLPYLVVATQGRSDEAARRQPAPPRRP